MNEFVPLEEAERGEGGVVDPRYKPPGNPAIAKANSSVPAVQFNPSPFIYRDPSTFPRRQFVYGRHYVRGFLSATAAATKVGKSSLALVEAVAMASGQNLLGIAPIRPMRVWCWNGEDPREELERRVLAICLRYNIDREEVERNLFLDSGRETEIIVATQTKTETVIATPVGLAVTDLRKVQAAIDAGRWRENLQSKDWAGIAVARTLGLDATNKAHKAKVSAMLKTWITNGMFVVVEGLDAERKKRNFIEVGMPAND
jgi:hypothetical protein